MMRRIMVLLTVVAMMVAMMVVTAGVASAKPFFISDSCIHDQTGERGTSLLVFPPNQEFAVGACVPGEQRVGPPQ